MSGGGGAEQAVLPLTAFGDGCEAYWVQGSHASDEDGELTFVFDNTSSWFSGMVVECMFSIGEPAAGGSGSGSAAEKERELQLTKAPGGSYTLWSL